MQQKPSEPLQQLEAFARQNNRAIKRVAVVGGVLLALTLWRAYFSVRGLARLDRDQKAIEAAWQAIQKSGADRDTAVKVYEKPSGPKSGPFLREK